MARPDPVVVRASVEYMPETVTTYEIPRADWDAMTPTQRQQAVDACGAEAVNDLGGYGASVDDPDDEAALAGALPSALHELHAELLALHRAEGSSNDWAQAVDDFFVSRGLPTILYG